MHPVVTIVGRPNVGKSSLLNALLGRRYAIVDDMAGVTRDRVSATCRLDGKRVELVDTGGIGIVDKQALETHVEAQIEQALAMSDAVIFVCDARDGCTSVDREIAAALRRLDVPVTLAVNKAESNTALATVSEFSELGWDPLPVSALERVGLGYLEEIVAEPLDAEVLDDDEDDDVAPAVRIAIVGRVNVGKSTFLNHLAGAERAIVSEVPGTTRDAVDLLIEKDGLRVQITDTAGIKRESAVQDSVEFYAQRRAEHSITRSDVALLVLDCTDDLTKGDRQIAQFCVDACKPVVIVANKWDLATGKMDISEYADYIGKKLRGLHFAPIVFTTAAEGKNVLAAIDTAQALFRQASIRVGTPEINRVLEVARKDFRPPVKVKGNPKIFYGTQIDVNPPTLMLFVNDPRSFSPGYRRFLENRMREALPFKEIPLRIIYKRRRSIFKKDH